MESAIDQFYDEFEREFKDDLWWTKAKDRGLGYKVWTFL